MNPLPASTGYLALGIATLTALLNTFAASAHDLTMLIWSLLVVGAVIVVSARE